MIKQYLGLFLIILPIVIGSFMLIRDLEYVWFYSINYKVYDLTYAIFSLLLMVVGLALFYQKRAASAIILFSTLFIVYQVLGWNFSTQRYLSLLELSPTAKLVMVSYDGGAFTASNVVNLEVSRRYGFIFIKNTAIKSYENISIANIYRHNDNAIKIDMQDYAKTRLVEYMDINDILAFSYVNIAEQ
ncbi:MAG: hypothetical protein ACPG52_09725 [Cognaticolwellia sp.]